MTDTIVRSLRQTREPERRQVAATAVSIIQRWGVLLLVGLLWQRAAVAWESPYFPPITEILYRTWQVWGAPGWNEGAVLDHVVPSMLRYGVGWSIAVAMAVALGLAIGLVPTVAQHLFPVVNFVRSVPPPLLLPLLIAVIGIGDDMKVVLIVVGVTPPLLLNTIDGVRSVDQGLLDTGAVFGIPRTATIARIVLPAAMPKMFAGLRISLAVGLILMVVSEMFAATNGIGFFIVQAQRGFRLVDMWTGVILLGVIGYGLNQALTVVEHRALRWHRGARGVTA
jgi:ABC-type nitrate/sulfonate/bicarbonate transport system permease component